MQKRRFVYLFVALFAFLINVNLVNAANFEIGKNKDSVSISTYSSCVYASGPTGYLGTSTSSTGVIIYVVKLPSHAWFNTGKENVTFTCKTKDGVTTTAKVTVKETAKVYDTSQLNSDNSSSSDDGTSSDTELVEKNCNGILGRIDDDGSNNTSGVPSVAYVLQKTLNFIKFLGPILVIAMTIFDLVKVVTSNDKEALNKLGKTTSKRLIYAVALFVFPSILNFMLLWISVHGTCELH